MPRLYQPEPLPGPAITKLNVVVLRLSLTVTAMPPARNVGGWATATVVRLAVMAGRVVQYSKA
jgi:hypothetical protein